MTYRLDIKEWSVPERSRAAAKASSSVYFLVSSEPKFLKFRRGFIDTRQNRARPNANVVVVVVVVVHQQVFLPRVDMFGCQAVAISRTQWVGVVD